MYRDLRNMLERSGRHLRNLTLRGRLLETGDEWIRLFSVTPSVENLTINLYPDCGAVLTDEFFHALSFNSVPRWRAVLSHLETFHLSLDESLTWLGPNDNRYPLPNIQAMFSMINSRRMVPEYLLDAGLHKLQYFDFHCKIWTPAGRQWIQDFNSDVEPRLRALEVDGLQLNLRTYAENVG